MMCKLVDTVVFFFFFKREKMKCELEEILGTDEEIRRGIFGMRSFKAPREDGFHALFYQSQCDGSFFVFSY